MKQDILLTVFAAILAGLLVEIIKQKANCTYNK